MYIISKDGESLEALDPRYVGVLVLPPSVIEIEDGAIHPCSRVDTIIATGCMLFCSCDLPSGLRVKVMRGTFTPLEGVEFIEE